jgi:hypothetical protein
MYLYLLFVFSSHSYSFSGVSPSAGGVVSVLNGKRYKSQHTSESLVNAEVVVALVCVSDATTNLVVLLVGRCTLYNSKDAMGGIALPE